ncbi:MAG TPA: type II toxin-antitoxin system PemK/MazF family toxin [Roseiarcus sp.]|nr:type II toxin-antitoxin system PemK/MazF family toxin [Roseiarcus sp.]
MRRGEVWTVAGSEDYAGKPRPVVIIQDDSFEGVDSLVVCPFTSDTTEASLFRLPVEPNPGNGLWAASRLMVDKITVVPKSKMGERIGSLNAADIVRLNRSMLVFLGLVASSRAK